MGFDWYDSLTYSQAKLRLRWNAGHSSTHVTVCEGCGKAAINACIDETKLRNNLSVYGGEGKYTRDEVLRGGVRYRRAPPGPPRPQGSKAQQSDCDNASRWAEQINPLRIDP